MIARQLVLPASLAATIAAALSAPATAQDRDCRTLRAFANADGRNLADLHFGVDPGSGVQLRSERGPAELTAAESCDVQSDRNGTLVTCQWRFRDYASASAFFEPMLERTRRCLDSRLPAVEIARANSDWVVMRHHAADFIRSSSETRVELQLIEWNRRADAYLPAELSYFVDLEVELEFEEAEHADDEEAEEEAPE